MTRKVLFTKIIFMLMLSQLYSQEDYNKNKYDFYQNNPELQKLSLSNMIPKPGRLSKEARQSLEARGFKVHGVAPKLESPRKDSLAEGEEIIRIRVSFELNDSKIEPIPIKERQYSRRLQTSADTIMTEGFEDEFPGILWQLTGDPTWGKTDKQASGIGWYMRPHSGKYHAFCAGSGNRSVEPGIPYPPEFEAVMIYGPVDLSNANSAALEFYYWLNTELEKDWFIWGASLDGQYFSGTAISGNLSVGREPAWNIERFFLTNVPELGDITGKNNVWISFTFLSDEDSTGHGGVFIDDIALWKKQVAGTPIAGAIKGIMSPQKNPFVAIGDVGVAEGDTLVIEPGVEIKFDQFAEFIQQGFLLAIGNETDSILFTSNQNTQQPGDWEGIGLYGPDSSIIKYSVVEYSGQRMDWNPGRYCGVFFANTKCHFTNNNLRKNIGKGVWFWESGCMSECLLNENEIGVGSIGANPTIFNNVITNNKTGISLAYSDALVKENEIFSNSERGIYGTNSSFHIVKNRIYNNGSEGIMGEGPNPYISSEIKVIDNTIFGNKGHGLKVSGMVSSGDIQGNKITDNQGNGFDIRSEWAQFNIYNNVLSDNDSCGLSFAYVGVEDARIENNIIAGNGYAGLYFDDSEKFWIFHNDFFNNGINILSDHLGGLGAIDTTNKNGDTSDSYFNIFLDPGFIEGSGYPFELSVDSPCRDAGNPNAFFNDVDGTTNDIGAYGGSQIWVHPTRFDFGPMLINQSTNWYFFELVNDRVTNLNITSIQLLDNSCFSLSKSDPVTLLPYSHFKIGVSFTPKDAGQFSTVLRFTSSDFYGKGYADIELTGEGIRGTKIGGSLTGTLTRSNSPYFVVNDILVPRNQTLTIESGSKIIFPPPTFPREGIYSFEIEGSLKAVGTMSDSIIMTNISQYENEYWSGIIFKNANTNCIIKYCRIEFAQNGITCENSSPTILNSTITNCNGVGIVCISNSAPTIDNNRIVHNRCKFQGAGIYCEDSSPIIQNNVISNNKSEGYGGGNSDGGGIFCTNSFPIISNNIITYNEVKGGGGGIMISGGSITNNFISHNTANFGGGCYFDKKSTKFVNNFVCYNKARTDGGGLYFDMTDIIESTINSTIVGNYSSEGYGGIGCYVTIPVITNSIIYFNHSDDRSEQMFGVAMYSDIQGGCPGEGNIDARPLFVDSSRADFRLQSNSPCIDKGSPDPVYNDPEDSNNPGYALSPALGTIRNDMGAYGGPGVADWNSFTAIESNAKELVNMPQNLELFQNYPNPFNPMTTIKYGLPISTEISLAIYNVLGQLVKILVDEKLSAGFYTVHWNGTNEQGLSIANGVYICSLRTKNLVISRKLLFIQ